MSYPAQVVVITGKKVELIEYEVLISGNQKHLRHTLKWTAQEMRNKGTKWEEQSQEMN